MINPHLHRFFAESRAEDLRRGASRLAADQLRLSRQPAWLARTPLSSVPAVRRVVAQDRH